MLSPGRRRAHRRSSSVSTVKSLRITGERPNLQSAPGHPIRLWPLTSGPGSPGSTLRVGSMLTESQKRIQEEIAWRKAENAMTKTSKSGCGCGGAGRARLWLRVWWAAVLCAAATSGAPPVAIRALCDLDSSPTVLTEEDLQKRIDYVVAKNRLHSQRLWGDGVVCGLEVSCHPCGGGTVVVNPGYALDCCGNDLVLSCPQELDINAMVRDLKRSLRGGYDCGDPCPPPKRKETEDPKAQQDTASQPSAATGANIRVIPSANATARGEIQEQKDTTRHYCLYIRYCETPTDPVSPYATDEGCSYQSCQPTRVTEGVSFELRCKEDCGHQPDIRDRICECIGDLDSAFQTTKSSNSFHAAIRLQKPVENVELSDRFAAGRNFVSSVSALKKVQIPQPSAPTASSEPSILHSRSALDLIKPSLTAARLIFMLTNSRAGLSAYQRQMALRQFTCAT